MTGNGESQQKALARIDTFPRSLLTVDPQVSQPATAAAAAMMTDWLGFRQLVEEHPDLWSGLPKPATDADGNPTQTAPEYLAHVWPLLDAGEQAAALEYGLQQMITLGHVSDVGIQVRVWDAYKSKEWMNSPECPDDFRQWVMHVMVDTLDGSKSAASHLANVVEAVAFLRSTGSDWLPKDLRTCFMRPYYRRWQGVAAGILSRKRELEELARALRDATTKKEIEALNEEKKEVLEKIEELAEAVADDAKTTTDLDRAGRQRPSLPPPVFEELPQRGQDGRVGVEAWLSLAQRALLIQKLKGWGEYRLHGEEYNTDRWDYVEYRRVAQGPWEKRVLDEKEGTWPDAWDTVNDLEGKFDNIGYNVPGEITVLHYWVERE